MGFFSWQCPECDLSITYAQNIWQNTCIFLPKKFYGSYDGYGRIFNKDDTYDINSLAHPRLYHLSCWLTAGMPKVGTPSLGAADQGYFIEEDARGQLLDPVAVLETFATHPYEDLPLLINQVSLMPPNMKRLYEDLLAGRVSHEAVLQRHQTVHRWLNAGDGSRAELLE